MCPSSLPPVSRTIATLTAVVALTLAACGTGTSDTTTTIPTVDTRGWSDEAFRDLMAYCGSGCATFIIDLRDTGQCSVEATYRIINDLESFFEDLVHDVLIPAGDCRGFDE